VKIVRCSSGCEERVVKCRCICLYRKQYYQDHKEHHNSLTRKWRLDHPERTKELQRKKYHENPEKHREYSRKWKRKNRDKLNARRKELYVQNNMIEYHRKWKQNNRDKINMILRKKYREDSSTFKVRYHKHRSLLKNALGNHTVKEWLFVRNLTHGICPSCNKFIGVENLTEDHVFSLNNFGTNYIDNIQALCHSCNCAKNDKNILYVGGDYVVKRDFNKMFDQTKVIAT
jgi:hypothetical protein